MLGLLLTPETPREPETPQEPEAPTASPVEEESSAPPPARRRPTGRRAITTMLPRVEIEVLPPEVQREGLDAFERIGEETSEVIEHRPASLVVVVIVRPKFVRKRALSLIRGLYRLERPLQGATRKKREEVRRQKSRPLVETFFAWCDQQAALALDETPICRALGYARNQRAALCRFLDDGRL